MFSKSSLSNRNEPITRKDVRSVFGGTSTSTDLGSKQIAPDSKAPATSPPVAAETTPIGENTIGSRLIVGSDVKLKGAEILDCDTLVVEGRVEATMDSRVIRIADKGAFIGKVSIDIAEIHGSFEGELTARSQLIIHATGRVSGKIRYGKLVIDEGGELCGDINALSSEKASSSRPITELPPTLNIIAG
ncbi:MAG: cell shape determination protein CcmA [Betaproteobacteria bacterium HGW-Betaproteobacteria-10]|nr:MAG: cell shape determination protein CcmA [Betaproteobacteria bacterium HGW-Betaproteobacteria-10]